MTSHCHCSMCRKGHAAAFATYVTLDRTDVRFLAGQELVRSYNSSPSIARKFCGVCGSNVEWSGHPKYPDLVAIPLALLDTPFVPPSIEGFFPESQVAWGKRV